MHSVGNSIEAKTNLYAVSLSMIKILDCRYILQEFASHVSETVQFTLFLQLFQSIFFGEE